MRAAISETFLVPQPLFRLGDLALLGDVNGTQLSELADFRIDLDLLDDGRIVGSGRFDFRLGKSATVKVF